VSREIAVPKATVCGIANATRESLITMPWSAIATNDENSGKSIFVVK
jgi:hypothetical protein